MILWDERQFCLECCYSGRKICQKYRSVILHLLYYLLSDSSSITLSFFFSGLSQFATQTCDIKLSGKTLSPDAISKLTHPSLHYRLVFLSVIWLPHGQLLAIIERTSSLTRLNHYALTFLNLKITGKVSTGNFHFILHFLILYFILRLPMSPSF